MVYNCYFILSSPIGCYKKKRTVMQRRLSFKVFVFHIPGKKACHQQCAAHALSAMKVQSKVLAVELCSDISRLGCRIILQISPYKAKHMHVNKLQVVDLRNAAYDHKHSQQTNGDDVCTEVALPSI